MAKNLVSQFNIIARNITKHLEEKGKFAMRQACYSLMQFILDNRGFHDVTGNMVQSYGVLLFHRGNLIMNLNPRNFGHGWKTRGLALNKGERFHMKEYGYVYYSGMEVYWDDRGNGRWRPYYGETEIGSGVSGKAERSAFVSRMKSILSGNANMFQVIAFCAVPYASYTENKKGLTVLKGAGEELDRLVQRYWKSRNKDATFGI